VLVITDQYCIKAIRSNSVELLREIPLEVVPAECGLGWLVWIKGHNQLCWSDTTVMRAIAGFRMIVVGRFVSMTRQEEHLGPLMLKQLEVLRTYLRKRDAGEQLPDEKNGVSTGGNTRPTTGVSAGQN